MKQHLIDFYLDYVNNYITIEAIAADNYMSINMCAKLVEMGKILHEANVSRIKELAAINKKQGKELKRIKKFGYGV